MSQEERSIFWEVIIFVIINKKSLIYEEESVDWSQMDIKRETYDIRTWEKHLFLHISVTNIDTLVPPLYQCVEICSTEVTFDYFSTTSTSSFQTFGHQRNVRHQGGAALCDKLFPS
jgi:hypothetical protein